EDYDCFDKSNETEERPQNDRSKDICESKNNRFIVNQSETAIPGCEGCTCCQRKDCYTESKLYSGTWSRTLSGRTCQRWDTQFPHAHIYNTSQSFPMDDSVSEAQNFCRTPVLIQLNQVSVQPWCLTTDPDTPWGVCGIPPCDSGQILGTKTEMCFSICVAAVVAFVISNVAIFQF
ncbi:plasminogen-like, partial [Mercenaria mercenaria]|uniref:plasminogen-like n=1 Tax=Mercenaria mercenaria TaxID=6596 RepID=UPI00234E3E84